MIYENVFIRSVHTGHVLTAYVGIKDFLNKFVGEGDVTTKRCRSRTS